MLKVVAWTVLIICILNAALEPFFYGKKREPYGAMTWIVSLIEVALLVPLCLRVLGVF